ncbi:MAG: hypothetical protein AAGI01_04935 [Myxococcota bacterium]
MSNTTRFAHHALAALTFLALGTAVASCGSCERAEPSAQKPVEETVEELVTFFSDFTCEEVFRCPEATYSNLPFLGRYPTLEACKADENMLKTFLRGYYSDMMLGVESGRVLYDAQAAVECLMRVHGRFNASICTTGLPDDEPSCEHIFTGVTELNQGCQHDDECAGNLECVEAFAGDTCSSRCIGCGGGPACADDEYCAKEDVPQTCKKLSPIGGPCLVDEMCGDEDEVRCNLALGETEEDGQCVAIGQQQLQEPCSEDEQCARGLACNGLTCIPPKIVGQQEACSITSAVVGLCRPGLGCVQDEDFNPRCVAHLGEGESCRSILQCAPGLQCEPDTIDDRFSLKCRDLRPDAQLCELPFECASGQCFYLDERQGFCVTRVECTFSSGG